MLTQLGIGLYRYAIGLLGSVFSVSLIYKLSSFCQHSKLLNTIGKETLGIYIISSYLNVQLLQRATYGLNGLNFIFLVIESIAILLCCHIAIYLIQKSRLLNRYLLGAR